MMINNNSDVSNFVMNLSLRILIMNSNISNRPALNVTTPQIIDYIDDNVNPCDNFYRFVCDKYLKNAIAHDPEQTQNEQELVADKLSSQLIDILKKPSLPSELQHLQSMKKFFTRCSDTRKIDEQGFEPLIKLLERLGGWPILMGDQWNDETWTWYNFLNECRDSGVDKIPFVDLEIVPNPKDTSKLILNIQSGLAVDLAKQGNSETSLSDAEKERYEKSIVEAVKLISGNSVTDFDEEKIKVDATKILEFYNELRDISEPSLEPIYNPMTIKNMTAQWPSIPWLDFFVKLFPAHITIDENQIINVGQPNYLTKFEKLVERTSKTVQANFGIWHIIQSIAPILPTQHIEWFLQSYGNYPWANRDEYCLGIMENIFPIAINALYAREYFSEEDIKNVNQMIMNIKTGLYNVLNRITWMDDETRQRASKKVKAITNNLGNQIKLLNDEILEDIYSDLELDCDIFFNCFHNAVHYVIDHQLDAVKTPRENYTWTFEMIREYGEILYSPQHNTLSIPSRILRQIYYGKRQPNYINYGQLGSVIGAQLLNSFINDGILYDEEGNMNVLWTNSTKKQFDQKSKCLFQQLRNNSQRDNKMFNKEFPQSYFIEVYGGIKMAYLGYNNWQNNNEVETLLPGFNSTFTPKKLYWTSLAKAECTRFQPGKYSIDSEFFPPESLINGAFANIEEFSQDFECPKESYMNRGNICAFW